MTQFSHCRFLPIMAGAFVLALLPHTVHAQVTATPTVTLIGSGLYHYDYTITNNTADELAVVTIHVLPNLQPGVDSVFNVQVPAGSDFTGQYTDSVLGLVDYVEGINSIFTPGTPISGFSYDSSIAPQASIFDSTFFTTGPTVGTTVAAVPEPGSLALLSGGGMAACFAMRKRAIA